MLTLTHTHTLSLSLATTTATPPTSSFFNSTASPFQPSSSLQQPQPQQQQTAVTSPSTYPFQYLQQCFDPNSVNYRFRVSDGKMKNISNLSTSIHISPFSGLLL